MIQKEKTGNFFFYESVVNAQKQSGINLPQDIEFYLVNLFSEQVQPEYHIADACLFDMLHEAVESPGPHQIAHYKRLGDASLMVVGFRSKRAVTEDYCLSMGQTGYSTAGELIYRYYKDNDFKSLYDLLSRKISECATIAKMALGAVFAPNKVE